MFPLFHQALTPPIVLERLNAVRQFTPLLLATVIFLLGSGTLEYLHNLDHAREDAIEDAQAAVDGKPLAPHHHDESNCEVHAQLHMPALPAAWVPLLICLGLWVAFLTLLDTPLIPRLLPFRVDCRGPPAV